MKSLFMESTEISPSLRAKIKERGGCWIWTGSLSKDGYGLVQWKEKGQWHIRHAHRLLYSLYREPIPFGLEIDHLCKQTRCVNPKHLEAVTHLENMRRGFHATKPICKRGHPLSGTNLRRMKNPVLRSCRSCHNQWLRMYRATGRTFKKTKGGQTLYELHAPTIAMLPEKTGQS